MVIYGIHMKNKTLNEEISKNGNLQPENYRTEMAENMGG